MTDFNDNSLTTMLRDLYLFIVIMTFLLLCAGCSATKPVILQRTVHDTAYVQRQHADSVILRDSVFVKTFAKGDTVYVTRYDSRIRERIRLQTDTVYLTRTRFTDIPVPAPSASAPWYARWLQAVPRVLFTALAICIAAYIWLYHRKR